MNPRIACFSLALLSLTACGQTGKLVLPEKNAAPPQATEVKPTVVAPIPNGVPDATPP
jgi:predicted small lipoprotein YifL